MSFSTADYLAMQAKLNRSRSNLCENLSTAKASSQKEVGAGGIQEQIENWLKTQSHRAWWDCKRSDLKTTSRIGVPDFVGVFAGVSFGMEVKRPGRKPTPEQLGELAWMAKAGAKTKVVYSVDEAIYFLLGLVKEEK